MTRRFAAAALGAVVGLSALAGCASGGDDDTAASQTLTVFAAASLTEAFSELAEDFEAANPGVEVRLSFDGSSGLVDQIASGAPADVFVSADETNMDRAISEGLVAGTPAVIATNDLTLITPPGNPAGITGLDGSLDGTRLVVCAEGVPCGNATLALAESAGVELRPVSEETKVTDVRGKVSSGEADAGIVYDAATAGDAVEKVGISGASAHPNRYPIAMLENSPAPDLGQRFIDSVTSPAGLAVLAGYGFGPP
ncbi:molybdate ABC transporter substrate-binding protein [Dietzia sp. NPDC055343]